MPRDFGDWIDAFRLWQPAGLSAGEVSIPSLGRPILIPLTFALAIPAFVRSLIFCASTFAKDESRARRIFRTSSLSVARSVRCAVFGSCYSETRSITRLTVCGCHRPPRGVVMPRAVNSAAICLVDMPDPVQFGQHML